MGVSSRIFILYSFRGCYFILVSIELWSIKFGGYMFFVVLLGDLVFVVN